MKIVKNQYIIILYLIIGYNFYCEVFIMKYVCDLCGWVYDEELGDPDNGIAAGTKFEDLPEDFVCPLCGAGKDSFSQE